MTSITIDDNGTLKTVTDIAAYHAERDAIVIELERIFADYPHRPSGALNRHERVIVECVNRYHQLDDWITQFETQEKRDSNINAGWTLLEQIRGAQA